MNVAIASRTEELRKSCRYWLRKSTLFCWASSVGEPLSGQGVTRDINNAGVYVLADELPQVGALVQLDIVFPKLPGSYLGMHLIGDGVVVRVEPHGATHRGFAASVNFYPQRADATLFHLGTSGQDKLSEWGHAT